MFYIILEIPDNGQKDNTNLFWIFLIQTEYPSAKHV